jgi:hypothetical protein
MIPVAPLSYEDVVAANRAANAIISQQADEMARLQRELDGLSDALMVRETQLASRNDELAAVCAALDTEETGEGLIAVARAACRAERELAQLERHREEADDAARNAAGL